METLSTTAFVIGCILFVAVFVGVVAVLLIATVVLSVELWIQLKGSGGATQETVVGVAPHEQPGPRPFITSGGRAEGGGGIGG